jgi:CheY-like chemotaxis protein
MRKMETIPIRVLLADDDESDRLLFTEAFEELAIKTIVHTVNNGKQLMEYLAAHVTYLPDLIFLDLNMPGKTGLECLKEIRSHKKYKAMSIAIYSTSAAEKDIQETFIYGANVYIKKPSDFNELKETLNKAATFYRIYQEPPFNIENFLLRI